MPLHPHHWPECPDHFNEDGLALVLMTLPPGTPRTEAGLLARSALPTLTAQLTGLPAEQINLSESAQGPSLTGRAADIRISLSYAGDKALIGLSRGRAIGVDIVSIEPIPELESLAQLYLPAASRLTVLQTSPGLRNARFALAWAEMEACCKALKLPLTEIDDAREDALSRCARSECTAIDDYRIAVALA